MSRCGKKHGHSATDFYKNLTVSGLVDEVVEDVGELLKDSIAVHKVPPLWKNVYAAVFSVLFTTGGTF
ncbi:MAG: hypothetical protein WCC97_10835 [Candidatus Acidiferrales bacterium]